VIRLRDDVRISRDVVIERLFKAGIGCSVHYIPLHLHPYWRDRYGLRPESFPHSQHAFERMISLPMYSKMQAADVDRVVQALGAALED
jgi:dTDP-4-amino-4,6-dideoxygalactose transaminase